MPADTPLSTALHEAGHMVVGHHFGMEFSAARVFNLEGKWRGACTWMVSSPVPPIDKIVPALMAGFAADLMTAKPVFGGTAGDDYMLLTYLQTGEVRNWPEKMG